MRKWEEKVVHPLPHFLGTHFADIFSYLHVNFSVGLLNLKNYIGSSFKNDLKKSCKNA